MRPASSTLKTFLANNREFVYCDAFTIELIDGSKYYYTNGPETFTVPPVDGLLANATYQAGVILISGMRLNIQIGSQVDSQQVIFTPTPGAVLGSLPFLSAVGAGVLDGAVIKRDRWFLPDWNSAAVGGTPMFWGVVSTVDSLSRTQAKLKVKADLNLLSLQMPRNVFQPGCLHVLFDSGCGLSQAAYAVSGVVGAGATTTFIPWTTSTTSYTLGQVHMNDGANSGLTRTIRAADTTGFNLAYPLLAAPAAGDHFTAYVGCDRTFARCTALGNTAHFRGFPYVPQSETSL